MSLRSDSSNEIVTLANPTSTLWDFAGGDDIAISLWFYRDNTTGIPALFGKRASGNGMGSIRGNGNEIEFYYQDTVAGTHVWRTSTANWSATTWNHVSLSFTYATGSSISCYVNGANETGSWTTGDGNTAPQVTDEVFASHGLGTGSGVMAGSLEAIILYKNASGVTAATLASNRNAPFKFLDGAIWAGRFDNTTTIVDLSGNGNNGTVASGLTLDTDGNPSIDFGLEAGSSAGPKAAQRFLFGKKKKGK